MVTNRARPQRELTIVDDGVRHVLRDQKCNGTISLTRCGREIFRAPNDRDHGETAAPCGRCNVTE